MVDALVFSKNGIKTLGAKGLVSSYPYLGVLKPANWSRLLVRVQDLTLNPHVLLLSTLPEAKLQDILLNVLHLTSKSVQSIKERILYIPQELEKTVTEALTMVSDPADFMIVYFGFWESHLLYAQASGLGGKPVYEVYTYGARMSRLTELLKYLREFTPLLTRDLVLEDLQSLIMNMEEYMPFRTSSAIVKDVTRGVFSFLLNKISKEFKVLTPRVGRIVVTGEAVQFLGPSAYYLLLAVIDALYINGLWHVYTDTDFDFLPSLVVRTKQPVKTTLPKDNFIYYRDPGQAQGSLRVQWEGGKKQFLMAPDMLQVFKLGAKAGENWGGTVLAEPSGKSLLTLKTDVVPTGVVIDTRKRPIPYGPTPSDNVNVAAALNKLKALWDESV